MTVAARPCIRCRQPELPGYPHRHDEPVRGDYDPMPERPERTYCGPLDVSAYWTGSDWRPACCLVHVAAAEYRAEIPEIIHPSYGRVPTRTEPIPLVAGALDGPMLDVLDAGELGGYPFALPAARRFGGVTMFDGEQTLDARDYRVFPWAYAIERRLPGHCRRRHGTRPDRWPEHEGRGPICGPIVRLVVARGYAPARVARAARLPVDRLEVLLDDSLRWVWRRVSEELNEIAVGRSRSTHIAQREG